MKTITGNLLNITDGVIVHQVNCRNRIGAGVAGALIQKYPVIKQFYHYAFEKAEPKELFGTYQVVPVDDNLKVINSFSQFYYGNAQKNGRVYTDMNKLVAVLKAVCDRYDNVYIPEKIGCGLAGGCWNELVEKIKDLPITVVKLQEGDDRDE